MAKKEIIPKRIIKALNIDEIEIKTESNKILQSFIPGGICLAIVILCELYCIYKIRELDVSFILILLIPVLLLILRFIVSNWSLKIYNSKLIIIHQLKKYIIDINKLISIEDKHCSYRGTRTYYLNIIFEEHESLKEINLIYRVKSPYMCKDYANIMLINYLINSIEYKYTEPIFDGDALNLNGNKNEIFTVVMIILIGWVVINTFLYIMMRILGE